jgi:phosphatidylethanolamine/phosphatidyl-N-methylethanolamine N-methyltransferase
VTPKRKRPFNFEKSDIQMSVDAGEFRLRLKGPVLDLKLKKPDFREIKEKTRGFKEKTAQLRDEIKHDLGKLKKPNFDEETRFLKSLLDSPLKTGAVSPSSKELARAMAQPVDLSLPGDVVELGPGTGPVTEALLAHGVPPERLVLIEFNPDFVTMLRDRFPGVRVIEGDAYRIRKTLELACAAPLAAVVSSLPLINKPENERLRLVHEAFSMLDPAGPFIQFTYSPVSPVPLKGQMIAGTGSRWIWKNLPPARVWTYRRKPVDPARKP